MKTPTKINSKENENKERNQRTYSHSASGFSWNLCNQNKWGLHYYPNESQRMILNLSTWKVRQKVVCELCFCFCFFFPLFLCLIFKKKKKRKSSDIKKKINFYNIFTINHRWLVIIGSNLNLTLRLLFAITITISDNLSLKIYYKNTVDISFLKQNILFYL